MAWLVTVQLLCAIISQVVRPQAFTSNTKLVQLQVTVQYVVTSQATMSLSERYVSCKFSVASLLRIVLKLYIIYHTAAHRVRSKNSASSGLVTSESFVNTVASFS